MPEETVDLDALWSQAIDGLTDSTVTPQQRGWLRTTRPLGLLDGTALLAAPNEFTKDVLETRLRPMITGALSRLLGRDIRVAVTVEPPPAPAEGATVVPLYGGDDGRDQVAEETVPGMHWPPLSAVGGRPSIRAWVRIHQAAYGATSSAPPRGPSTRTLSTTALR